jgi:hypothetical protein
MRSTVGLTALLKKASNNSQQSEGKREQRKALSLAKECYFNRVIDKSNSSKSYY